MRLFDSARGDLVRLPEKDEITLYTCGITPYDASHVGHAACYLTFDLVERALRDQGVRTRLVRNITDVDDDILRKSRELGVFYLDLAAREIERFTRTLAGLKCITPWREPRATESIDAIQGMIARLGEAGVTYRVGGNVYFSVKRWPSFGHLSRLDPSRQLELAAENGGNIDDPRKENPLDFILWQESLSDEPSWPSPWGPGRPGWHIECSSMIEAAFGGGVDIHGGGVDLWFPHNECEAAQAEASTGEPLSQVWMHQAPVRYEGTKMSKSLGNLVIVSDLLQQWEGAVIRLAVIDHHYRTAWDWENSLLPTAARRLERWRSTGTGDGALADVREALATDLDVPAALAAIDGAAADGHGVSAALELLGLD